MRYAVLIVMLAALATTLSSLATAEVPDPTRPMSGAEAMAWVRGDKPGVTETLPDLHLESVLISSRRRVAVINGRRVAEGEELLGARILEIRPDGVRIQRAGNQHTLQMAARGSLRDQR